MSLDMSALGDILEDYQPQPTSRTTRKADPRAIAIQHAQALQHRKEIEAEILDSLLKLSVYPLVRTDAHSAAQPATQDVADFKQHIRLFQPSDYDDLITERNANNMCGYTLCARPKRKATPGGTWKLVNAGSKDFDIVNRKDHERWCSQICAKRALYIKVQLNETAAWEREGLSEVDFELYEEKDARQGQSAEKQNQERRREDEKRREAELALERGNGSSNDRLIDVVIRPKEVRPPRSQPLKVGLDDDSHLRVEGYKPKGSNNAAPEATDTKP